MLEAIMKNHTIVRGGLRESNLGYIACTRDFQQGGRERRSLFLVYHNDLWLWPADEDCTRWDTVSATAIESPQENALFMGHFGEIYRANSSGVTHEWALHRMPDGPADYGLMRSIRAIGARAYAVGMGRQAYRREGPDQWERIDHDCRAAIGTSHEAGFEAIHGLDEDLIFAVGRRGEIWRREGGAWSPLESPTSQNLCDVLVRADGSVLACGRAGALVLGEGGRWTAIDHDWAKDDLWGLCEFKGSTFVSGQRGLFELVGRELRVVDIGEIERPDRLSLSAAGDTMWAVGPKSIHAFDGSDWRRVV